MKIQKMLLAWGGKGKDGLGKGKNAFGKSKNALEKRKDGFPEGIPLGREG